METFGKYQLVKRLGAGGMAEVYLARSSVAQGLAKAAVIKKIHAAYAKSRHFQKMFVDEAKIALSLNHPNIVQVFDFGHVSQTYFLVMEYVEGVDLLRLMQEGAKLQRRVPYGLAAYVAQQIAKGLDYAHRKSDEYGEELGIVHRDVSPQNVLISWDGAVKLTDFGIARARDVHEEEGVVKGKFAYMSPEQARGLAVDRRSDIYSAGIVLYELACARPLFTGRGKEVLEAVRAGAVPRPRTVDPNLPQALEEIILKALAYHPEDRHQTARDLQHALGRFQLQLASAQDEIYDSGALAQYIAQTVPREKRARTTGELSAPPETPPPRAAAADEAATPVAKKHAGGAEVTPLSSPVALVPSETRERKQVIVLEGEISGLAKLRREVGEERARQAVVDFFRIAEHIAFKHDAHPHPTGVDDAFTYIVGLPVTGEDDPTRAIRLALALVDALDGIGRDVEPDLRLSVGIQRGVALVTRGAGAQFTYELSPQTLAFARRLAKEAQGGEVLVGGGVYRVARAEWNFEEIATIELDDSTDPGDDPDAPKKAKVHRLRGIKEREQRMRERTAEGPLVGRELERKAIKDAYREVVRLRRKHHVLIIGEEGVGKRSLISGFLQSLPSGEAMVLRAACRAATSDTPFSVVADLSRDMLGLAEGAEPREVKRRLQAAATTLYPAASETREVQGLVNTVGMLLGIKVASDEIDAEERATRILQALRRIEERLAKDQPVVVIVEDVHWADSQSWDVFLRLINEPAQRTVLGLATARPDERILHAATEAESIMTLVLDELGPEDRIRLVAQRFAPGEDVRALSEEIVAKAGGNPFYILELIDSLVERGTVAESREHPGKLTLLKRDVHLQAPTSVQALVATRLDRLPFSEKEVLLLASVIGREFASGDLEALLGRGVDEDLHGLLRRQLVERRGGGYAFRNEMTQQVAYELLPPEAQARLHRRVADRLAGSPGYRAGQDDAVLARHLERAGDGAAAAQRYLAAAMHARDVLGNAEAFQHLSKALALLPREAHAERLEARGEREAILRAWGHRAQQLRELHQMRREAEALGDAARIADVLSRTAQFYLDVDKAPQAQRVLGPALAAARASGQRLVEAEVLRMQSVLARSLGENQEALVLVDRALALCGDDRPGLLQRATILNNKGTTLWQMSRLREAIEAHAEALVIYRKLRVPRQEAKVLNNIGIVFSALGEYEEALTNYKRSLKIDQELGNRLAVAVKLANIGGLYVDVGDLDKAEPYLGKALAIAGELGDPATQTDATITLGQAYLKRGDLARARRAFDKGHTQAAQAKNRYQEIRALVYLALATIRSGEPPDRALAMAREATDLAEKARILIGQMYGLTAQGLALRELGRLGEAAEVAGRAVEVLDRSHAPEGSEEILYHYARILLAAGRAGDAAAALRRSHDELQAKARRIKDPALRARFLAASPARDILAEVGYHEPA